MFEFELTRKLGYRSYREMRAALSTREYMMWMAYKRARLSESVALQKKKQEHFNDW